VTLSLSLTLSALLYSSSLSFSPLLSSSPFLYSPPLFLSFSPLLPLVNFSDFNFFALLPSHLLSSIHSVHHLTSYIFSHSIAVQNSTQNSPNSIILYSETSKIRLLLSRSTTQDNHLTRQYKTETEPKTR
jgi:hypothetical protein